MKIRWLCSILCSGVFLTTSVVCVSSAEVGGGNGEAGPEFSSKEIQVEADGETDDATSHLPLVSWGASGGYRLSANSGAAGRAAEYDYLHSSASGGLFYNYLSTDLKFALDGDYRNKKDFVGDLLFDYSGYYRLHLRSESFFHNLGREADYNILRLNPPPIAIISPDPAAPLPTDGVDTFGVRVSQDQGNFRFKFHDFPAHVHLGYWSLHRDGISELRFGDVSFSGPNSMLYAMPREVDNSIREITVGFDSHLGPVDLNYTLLGRKFENNAAVPVSDFFSRSTSGGTLLRNGGLQEHNEDPESSYLAHTVKLHTSLSGGLVGSGSYTYGTRENNSQLTQIIGADQARTIIRNFAGDLSYTPVHELTMTMRYRRFEQDNETPSFLQRFGAPAVVQGEAVAVRPPFDSTRDVVTANIAYRPHPILTIMGEYRGDFLKRTFALPTGTTSSWYLPDQQQSNRGSVTILSRPLKGMRLKALYSYQTTDHPAYGSTPEQRQQGELYGSYAVTSHWGLTANYRVTHDQNDAISYRLASSPTTRDPLTQTRDRTAIAMTAGVWYCPVPEVTFSATYGLLRDDIDQGINFTVTGTGSRDTTNYRDQAQVFSLSMNYVLTEEFNFSMTAQQVSSFAVFSPTPIEFSPTSSTFGVSEISRVKTVENSLAIRGEYQMNRNLSGSLEYTLRDYEDQKNSNNNGTSHVVTALLRMKW